MAESKSLIDRKAVVTSVVLPKPAQVVTLPSLMHCHEHSYAQIVIGLRGLSEFDIEGYGNRIGPGKGCIVASHSDHAYGGFSDNSDILVLNFPLTEGKDDPLLQQINATYGIHVYFSLDGQIQQLITLLVREMRRFPDDILLSESCNHTLLAILQHHIKGFDHSHRDTRFDLSVIDNYIERHMGHAITIAQLAGSVYLGESQFYLLFKQQLGITPHQYILVKRMDTAKLLIETGRYSLGQVADMTGFSTQSSFTRLFSHAIGMSPSRYKKQFMNC